VRAAAHEDINLLTLLIGSEQAGLEVLSRTGEWIPISMIEGTIVCNVGDMLQRLSNNTLPSTTHRVVNPQGSAARTSRYSMPFFMHPSPDVSLDVLPQCVDESHPAIYPPITAGEFLQQRLHEIGLVKT
jgi:isopenicillin N synthase-like dioxygenase